MNDYGTKARGRVVELEAQVERLRAERDQKQENWRVAWELAKTRGAEVERLTAEHAQQYENIATLQAQVERLTTERDRYRKALTDLATGERYDAATKQYVMHVLLDGAA